MLRRIVLLFRQTGQNNRCRMNRDGQRDWNWTFVVLLGRCSIVTNWTLGIRSLSVTVVMTMTMCAIFFLDVGF